MKKILPFLLIIALFSIMVIYVVYNWHLTNNANVTENKELPLNPQEESFDTQESPFGIWETGHYVDEFDEETEYQYVRNADKIIGEFSNSATEGSALAVRLLIDNPFDISIILYEYAGKNPVKKGRGTYSMSIQDKDGKRYHIDAYNSSDRLTLRADKANTLYEALSKGGSVKFVISNLDYANSVYKFTILNADHLKDALKSINAISE